MNYPRIKNQCGNDADYQDHDAEIPPLKKSHAAAKNPPHGKQETESAGHHAGELPQVHGTARSDADESTAVEQRGLCPIGGHSQDANLQAGVLR